MIRSKIILLLIAILLTACGPSTQPSDLAGQPTAGNSGGGSIPAATVAGTPIALPMVIRGTEGSPTPGPTLPPPPTSEAPPTATSDPTPTPEAAVRFAVIGDYGAGTQPEADVAALVVGWQPEFIITTGDNNYPEGAAEVIDPHIGRFYHSYIAPYVGDFGDGADQNRFFPSLGNHDWDTAGAQPYLDYFTLPGNERYYDFTWGPVQFFVVDSDSRDPDGVLSGSPQGIWLQNALAGSTSPWQIVYFHTAPYSSGTHGSTEYMRWPFKDWGADAVLSGHDHTYERLSIDGLTYFVNGLGGGGIYDFLHHVDGSQVRYNDDHGAMLVEATSSHLTFQFISIQGDVVGFVYHREAAVRADHGPTGAGFQWPDRAGAVDGVGCLRLRHHLAFSASSTEDQSPRAGFHADALDPRGGRTAVRCIAAGCPPGPGSPG